VAKYRRAGLIVVVTRSDAADDGFFFFFIPVTYFLLPENPHEEMPARDQVRTAFRSLRSLAFLLTPFATISFCLGPPDGMIDGIS
jgi:hypothetical protein